MKIKTVNVIEYFNNNLQAVHSFTDDPVGNEEAEKLFASAAKDNNFSDEEIKVGLEEGYLEHSNSDYQLYLVHSD